MDKRVQKGAKKYRAAGALETDVILENLFSHMHADDLKSCRLACKQWHKFATPALEKRLGHVVLQTARMRVAWNGKGAPKALEDFDAFATATAAAEATIDLKPVKFRKFTMNFLTEKSRLTSVIVSDWVTGIVSLNLSGLIPQDFNGCILGIMHRMTQLKHLGVRLDYNFSNSFVAIQAPWPENVVFRLESLVIREYISGALDKTNSEFLKQCKNLRVLSLDFAHFGVGGRPLRWLDDFKNKDYPRGITTLSLKWCNCFQREDNNAHLSSSIAAFLNLFPLEDLRLRVTFSAERRWDIINVLRSIQSRKITKLALELALPFMGALDKSRVMDVFRALSLPQYRGLEDLKIGIEHGHQTAEVEETADANANARAVQESFFILPSIKNLVIKFAFDWQYWQKGQVAIMEMLKIAAVKMPELKSLSTDAFSAKALKDVVKVLGGFVNLKELTLNGGRKTRKVRADTLFGIWDAKRKNSFKGLFALSKMEKLTLVAPPGTHLDKEAFERGFLEMPQLRNLRINDGGLTKISQPELDSLELGKLTFERDIPDEVIYWKDLVAIQY